jgi:hypothetical protein
MTTILIILKDGSIKEHCVKVFNESELYKKAGFKSSSGFLSYGTITNIVSEVSTEFRIYGKGIGRTGQENTYGISSNICTSTLFGNCIIAGYRDNMAVNIYKEDWITINNIHSDNIDIHSIPEPRVYNRDICTSKKQSDKKRKLVKPISVVDKYIDSYLDCADELSTEVYSLSKN